MTTLLSEIEADARVRAVLMLQLIKRKGIMSKLFKTDDGTIVQVIDTEPVDYEDLRQELEDAEALLAGAKDRLAQYEALAGVTQETAQPVPLTSAPIEQATEVPAPPVAPEAPAAPVEQPAEPTLEPTNISIQ